MHSAPVPAQVPPPAPADATASRPGEHAPVNWLNVTVFTLTPLAALVLVPWYGFSQGFSGWAWASLVLFLYACGLSITVGYHRLWSHQTFQAHVAVRWVLAVFGAMALQNSILIWASQHRRHHLHVDDIDRDPYSATRGFWFSHMGWILRDYPSSQNDFSNARDLERDPVVAFQHRHYLALALGTNFGFPLALGWAVGDVWGVFLLGGLLRLVVNHHFTWFINSLAHMWGSQPYTDENTARDNPVMAFLTYGEGYHNFHHIFQNDYRNGVKWWQYDPTKWLIAALSWVGLASNLKRVPDLWIQRAQLAMQFKRTERALAQRQARAGDEQLERARARLAEEYAAFREALDDWAKVREQWLADRRQRLLQKWEETSFRLRLRQIETALRLQQRRLRAMSRAYV